MSGLGPAQRSLHIFVAARAKLLKFPAGENSLFEFRCGHWTKIVRVLTLEQQVYPMVAGMLSATNEAEPAEARSGMELAVENK